MIADRTLARLSTGVLLLLGACSHLHMPWAAKQAPPSQPVNELAEITGDGVAVTVFPQYWKRNTLIVDLQNATGTGSMVLKPRDGTAWPVRLAFRLRPGSFAVLEVTGAERMVIPVVQAGPRSVEVELLPGVYTTRTAQITVHWG